MRVMVLVKATEDSEKGLLPSPELLEAMGHFNDELRDAGAFLDGRVTYELMAAAWPTADADPTAPAPVVEFARIWRDMPKIGLRSRYHLCGLGACRMS